MPSPDHNLQLAAERTLLAWVRTGLALMGFGFVVARFGLFLREIQAAHQNSTPQTTSGSLAIGVGLVALGIGILGVAAVRFQRYSTALREGRDVDPPGQGFGVVVCLALAMLGVFMAVYLLTVS